MNRIQGAFDEIRADDALLEKTAAYLHAKRTKPQEVKLGLRVARRVSAFAAMLALVIGIGSYHLFWTAAAYVSIDINPSVELTLNRMNRVISTYAFNDDGEQILHEVDLSGRKYDEAVRQLVAAMDARGYMQSDVLVSVTVQTSNSDQEESLAKLLLQSIQSALDTAEIEVAAVSQQVWENAHGCHMSPAKYLAIQELLAVDDTATLEHYNDSSIRQIRQRTQQCKDEGGSLGEGSGHGNSDNTDDGRGSNQGGGHGNGHRGGQ